MLVVHGGFWGGGYKHVVLGWGGEDACRCGWVCVCVWMRVTIKTI